MTTWNTQPTPINGFSLASTLSFVNIRDFGAIGDGITDDTAAIQAALDELSGTGWDGASWNNPTQSGLILAPAGIYIVTSTLNYYGGSAYGISLAGLHSDEGNGGCVFRWKGAQGGTLLKLTGAVNSKIDDIQFDGAQSGHEVLYLVQMDATNDTQVGAPGSHDNVIKQCVFFLGSYSNSAAVALGHTTGGTTPQVSEIAFRDNYFAGSSVGSAIVSLVGGNTKNFTVDGGTVSHFDVGLDFSNQSVSASETVRDVTFLANVSCDVKTGNSSYLVTGMRSESSGKLLIASTGSNPAPGRIENSYWAGTCGADDSLVTTGGSLDIVGNYFLNSRTGSSVPVIQIANPRNDTGTGYGALHSFGNTYVNAQNSSGLSPFQDTSGNDLFTTGHLYETNNYPIDCTSLGDRGGAVGTPVQLTNYYPVGGNALFTQVKIGSAKVLSGTGTPEGTVTAPIGSLYLRLDGGVGTSLYVKQTGTGNTGWGAK